MRMLSIAVCGLLGVFSRYFVGVVATKIFPPSFPYGTLSINLIGSFWIGVVYVLGVERAIISEELRMGIMIGYLGGFTTFSSYCLEVARLLEEGSYFYATLYGSLSAFLGYGATFLGLYLGRWVSSRGGAL
jgi:CrcB protein